MKKTIHKSIICLIVFLLLTITANAKTYTSEFLYIVYENEIELEGAKQGAIKVGLFFKKRGYDIGLPLKIIFNENVEITYHSPLIFEEISIQVHAFYNSTTKHIEITHWEQSRRKKVNMFNASMTAELYFSLIIHEITHAILHSLQPKAKYLAHEYIAYIVQFSTMDEKSLNSILKEHKEIKEFENERQINSAIYELNPLIFGIKSYLHFKHTDKTFKKIIAGNFIPFKL